MKCFILLAIVCATIGFSEQALTKEQAMEMFKKAAEECAPKEGATAADIDEAMAHKLPSNKAGKCMHACVAENAGFMKDNKSVLESHIAFAKMAFGDNESRIKLVTDVATECGDMTDADRCEAAFKFMSCMHKAYKSHGVNLETDW